MHKIRGKGLEKTVFFQVLLLLWLLVYGLISMIKAQAFAKYTFKRQITCIAAVTRILLTLIVFAERKFAHRTRSLAFETIRVYPVAEWSIVSRSLSRTALFEWINHFSG